MNLSVASCQIQNSKKPSFSNSTVSQIWWDFVWLCHTNIIKSHFPSLMIEQKRATPLWKESFKRREERNQKWLHETFFGFFLKLLVTKGDGSLTYCAFSEKSSHFSQEFSLCSCNMMNQPLTLLFGIPFYQVDFNHLLINSDEFVLQQMLTWCCLWPVQDEFGPWPDPWVETHEGSFPRDPRDR